MAVIELSKVRIKFKRINKLKRPAKKLIIFGGLALCVVLIIILSIYFWCFKDYVVEISDLKENTLVYSYYEMDGNILKCASDSAMLTDVKNETLWSLDYQMSNPKADICGSYAVIYDKGGTSIIICDEAGKVSEFSTDIPLVKAQISSGGTVVALLDDGATAEIDYFDTDGSMIATVMTTMENDGYPMDISLSDNGMLLGVSYLTFGQGMTVSKVVFYDFDSAGQAAVNNIIGEFSYENEIIPELEYTQKNRFTAFGTDIISVYECGRTAEEIRNIETEDDIQSTFSNDKYFGYVMPGNRYTGAEIIVFNSAGKEIKRIETEFSYTSIDICDNLIIMYNRNEMSVYTTAGVLKFDGQIDSLVRQIRYFGANRYALAATDGYYVIRLS